METNNFQLSVKKDIRFYSLLALITLGSLMVNAQETNNQLASADSLNVDLLLKNLPEVVIKGERPIAKMERGQLSYNMPLLLERIPADNAFEALGNIPGVSVQNDDINFAGHPVTLIVDGKATTMSYSQVMDRLKSMPADRLAKVEVMLSAPARYHVRGAAINVVTKDYIGTRQNSGQLQGVWNQSRYSKEELKGNFLHVNNKLSIDANYSYTCGRSHGEVKHEAQHPLGNEKVAYFDYTKNTIRSITHDYRAGMDYQFAANHQLSFAYTGQWTSYHSNNKTTGESLSKQSNHGHNYLHNIDFRYTLPIGLQLTASYMNRKAPKSQCLDGTLNQTSRDIIALSNQDINKWLIAADESHTLSGGWGLSYGAKVQITKNNSYQTSRKPDGEILPEATSSVDIDERIVDAYLGFNKQIAKSFSIDGSITVENFHTSRWNDWCIYPSLNAIWNINDRNMLNLSFSSNAAYPSYWSTMNSINYSSTYSEIWGNPDLKPASNYDLSLMWQLDTRYMFIAFASFNPDFSVQLPYQPSDRMAVIMKEVNFDHRNTFGLQASAQLKAGTWLNGNAFLSALYVNDKCEAFFDLPFNRKKVTFIAGGTASALLSKHTNLRFILNPFFQSDAIQGVFRETRNVIVIY